MEESLIDTDHICADCGEGIPLVEEVFLVQILYQAVAEEGAYFYNVEDAGDFIYSPHFFCMKCWDTTKETLQGLLEDVPPLEKPDATRKCSLCGSGIANMETVAVITLGELRRSQRMPAGEPTIHFAGIQQPEVWCAHCAARLNADIIELWEGGFEELDDERDVEEESRQELEFGDFQHG